MRRTLIALLLAAAVPAFAQQQPAGLEPIPNEKFTFEIV